jgi:hypothetical protein
MEKGILGSPVIQRRRWPVTISDNTILLEAGSLDLLKEGDLVKVVGNADDGPPRKFRVSKTMLSRSLIEPVGPEPFNLGIRSGLTGELTETPTGLVVRVFIDQDKNGRLHDEIRARLDPRPSENRNHLRLVDKKHLSDLTIVPMQGEVRLFRTNDGPSIPKDGVVSIRCPADMCLDELVSAVARLSRAVQLTRIPSLNASALDASGLIVRGTIQRLAQSDEQPCGKWRADVERHIFLDTTAPQAVPSLLAVSNCDQLELNVSMSGKAAPDMAADITALYIGADGTIANMLAPGQNIRLQSGDRLTARQRSIRVGPGGITYPFGYESIMLIAAIRSASDPVRDYAWLARFATDQSIRGDGQMDDRNTIEYLVTRIADQNVRSDQTSSIDGVQLLMVPLLFRVTE